MKQSWRKVLIIFSVAGFLPATLFCAGYRNTKGRWKAEIEAQGLYLDADPSPLANALSQMGIAYAPTGPMSLWETRISALEGGTRYGVLAAQGGWQGGFAADQVDFALQWAGFFVETIKATNKASFTAGLAGLYGWTDFEIFGPAGVDRFKGGGLGGMTYAGVEIPSKGSIQLVARAGWVLLKTKGSWDGLRVTASGLNAKEYSLGGRLLQWGLRYRF